MFCHFGAAVVAFGWSLRYQRDFNVKLTESRRYWLKSINLALCYQGFSSDRKMKSWVGAGKAAFFAAFMM